MFERFIPDRIFDDVYQITPELLRRLGKTAVIFDIDNTLTCDKNAEPDDRLKTYLSSLTENGIQIALVSNNNRERVETFNRSLHFFTTPKAGKPKKSALIPSLGYFNAAKEQVLFVGDQVLTDVLAARKHAIHVFLVRPINRYENGFFYVKRLLERPFIRAYYKRREKETVKTVDSSRRQA